MRNAPTRWMGEEEAKVQLTKQVTELFHGTNSDFEMNDTSPSLFKYRLKGTDLDKAMNAEEVLEGLDLYKELRVERIDAKGNITNGVIQIESDKYSEFMPVGLKGSYGIYFKADDSFELSPIYDANRGYSNARFNITVQDSLNKLASEKAITDINNLERQKGLEAIREMERKVRQLRLEQGEDLYGL